MQSSDRDIITKSFILQSCKLFVKIVLFIDFAKGGIADTRFILDVPGTAQNQAPAPDADGLSEMTVGRTSEQ